MAQQIVVVEGAVSIRERVAIDDGVVTVKLVDASGEVLSAAAIDATGVPVQYALSYDPALVPDASKLLLWAVLRTDEGVWGTADLAPVDGEDVYLTRIPD